MYDILEASNLSCHCLKCGLPNLSSSYYNTTSCTSISQNSFSSLEEITSAGVPNATSSPIHRPILNNQIPTNTEPCKSPNLFKSNRPLKIVNVNFRSIKNKKPDLDILLDSLQPDIIIGTETWLDSSVSSSEYFSPKNYIVYRNDRHPKQKRTKSWWSVDCGDQSNPIVLLARFPYKLRNGLGRTDHQ